MMLAILFFRDKQMVMIAAAAQCCNCLGLKNGVFNVEFKMTGMGPKLIEINGRQGGFYIQVRQASG
jgi:hypothetical protein